MPTATPPPTWAVVLDHEVASRVLFGAAPASRDQHGWLAAARGIVEDAVARALGDPRLPAGHDVVVASDAAGAVPVPVDAWADGLRRWRDGELAAPAAAERIASDLLRHLTDHTKAA